jgi:hypothetical protein
MKAMFKLGLVLIAVGLAWGWLHKYAQTLPPSGQEVRDMPDPVSTSPVGQFYAPQGYNVVVGLTEDALARYGRSEDAGDKLGMGAIQGRGEVLSLPTGTRGRIIDSGVFVHEVRVESGPHAGKAVFVDTGLFRRDP